jgi:hypothetical protein
MADSEETDLTRRDLIKLGGAATLAASLSVAKPLAAQLPGSAETAKSAARTFFTPDELSMVDELSELIIPTDEHSPGARAAKVAAYIDSRLAEAWEEQERIDWREGLKRIDQLTRESGGKPFMQSSADERLAVLTRIAQNEKEPRQPEELFFAKLKSQVVNAYYTSEIGIKQEMEYKGNSYLTDFVGVDVS